MRRWLTWSRTSPPPISNCASVPMNCSSIRSSVPASSRSGSASMPLVENGKIVEDRFVAEADALTARDGSLGVAWPNNRRVAELKPWLGHLTLIALEFPKFRDGRAYSQARLLREQYGFRGTLRATGDVLRDQFQFLTRAGFDSFEVRKPADAAAFAKSVARYSVVYQPGADGSLPALRRRLQRAGAASVPKES